MSVTTERELTQRVGDLENALKAIGRIAADNTITPKARLQRVTGILSMYDCDPGPTTAALPLSAPNPQPPTPPSKDRQHA